MSEYLKSQYCVTVYDKKVIYTLISNLFPGYTNEDIDTWSFATSRGDRAILFGYDIL